MSGDQATVMPPDFTVSAPTAADGRHMWRIARDSAVLDLNSPYAYLLWCDQFSATSAVARLDEEVIGFVTGFRSPEQPNALMIWQIAVDDAFRGRGIGLALLNSVVHRERSNPFEWLKTTIEQSNTASAALFTAFADQESAVLSRTSMFAAADFPDPHDPEDLYVIGPLQD